MSISYFMFAWTYLNTIQLFSLNQIITITEINILTTVKNVIALDKTNTQACSWVAVEGDTWGILVFPFSIPRSWNWCTFWDPLEKCLPACISSLMSSSSVTQYSLAARQEMELVQRGATRTVDLHYSACEPNPSPSRRGHLVRGAGGNTHNSAIDERLQGPGQLLPRFFFEFVWQDVVHFAEELILQGRWAKIYEQARQRNTWNCTVHPWAVAFRDKTDTGFLKSGLTNLENCVNISHLAFAFTNS